MGQARRNYRVFLDLEKFTNTDLGPFCLFVPKKGFSTQYDLTQVLAEFSSRLETAAFTVMPCPNGFNSNSTL